jgi:vacuolar-type H+-ATPase subunit E/Vma4
MDVVLPDQVSLLSRAIRKKGQAEAEKILVRAREQAQGIVRDAEEKVHEELEQHLADKRKNAFQQARRLKDGATLRARQLLLQAKEELMQELFLEARQQLESMRDEAGYTELLQSIALQAIRELPGEEVWIQVRKDDQSLMSETFCGNLSRLSERKVVLFPEPAVISGGCLVYSFDKKVLVDFSFSALLSRAKPRLRELLAKEMLEE